MGEGRSGAAVRAAAARAVNAVTAKGRSVDAALASATIGDRDRPLLQALVYGTLREHFRLEEQLAGLLDRPLRKRDAVVGDLIRVGLFQMLETRVPDHAAVSATVEATRLIGQPRMSGLVNAILRRALREAFTPGTEQGSTRHPEWMLERFREDWPEDVERIIEANNARAPMWLRVNTTLSTTDQYAARLEEAGIAGERHPAVAAGIRLVEPMSIDELPGFAEGNVSVQDGGAQLAGHWLSSMSSGRGLDACSAPGGKAALWKELAGDSLELTCMDVDKERAGSIKELFQRLGLEATIRVADASNETSFDGDELYDAILMDAPCSASGVIRRHPDIRLLRRNADIDALSKLQTRMLQTLWRRLKPGGELLYITCSVFSEENDRVVGRFLETTPDAQESDVLQNNNIRALMRRKACGYQLLPGTEGMDGFYFASLAKAT